MSIMFFIWRTFRKISYYLEYISFTFLILYLWEQYRTLYPVITFATAFFIVAMIGATFSVFVTNTISPKISLLLSAFSLTGQAIVFIYFYNSLEAYNVILLGILGGLGSGFKCIPEYVFERLYESKNPEFEVQATKAYWWEVIKLLTTFLSAYIVYTGGGYNLLFQVILGAHVVNSLLILLLTNKFISKKNNFINILKIPGTNPLKWLIIKSEFMDGIYEGINLILIPVALLYFVRDILDWGLVNTLLIVLSIFFTIIVTKTSNSITYKNYYATSVFLFAMLSVLLITQYNIYVLIGYMIAMVLNEVAASIGYNTTIETLIDQDPQKNDLLPEYKLLVEIASGLGKLVPALILIFIHVDLNDEFVIQASLVVGSLLPLLIISMFGNTILFNIGEKVESTDTSNPPQVPQI